MKRYARRKKLKYPDGDTPDCFIATQFSQSCKHRHEADLHINMYCYLLLTLTSYYMMSELKNQITVCLFILINPITAAQCKKCEKVKTVIIISSISLPECGIPKHTHTAFGIFRHRGQRSMGICRDYGNRMQCRL